MLNKKYELFGDHNLKGLRRIRALRDFGDIKKGCVGGWVESEDNLSHHGDCWVAGNSEVLGGARVHGNAQVVGFSRVYGNAEVYGNAQVRGRAKIYGLARVRGNAEIHENAEVFGKAQVFGNAHVYGRARVYDSAYIFSYAHVCRGAHVFGGASIHGHALVRGDAEICGCAKVRGYALIGDGAQIKYARDVFAAHSVGSENGTLTAYRTKTGLAVDRGCFNGTLEDFEQAVDHTHGDNTFAREYRVLIDFIKLRFGVSGEK